MVQHLTIDLALGSIEGGYPLVALASALLLRLDGYVTPGPLTEQRVAYISEAGGPPATLFRTLGHGQRGREGGREGGRDTIYREQQLR